jgi:hypothetical protein
MPTPLSCSRLIVLFKIYESRAKTKEITDLPGEAPSLDFFGAGLFFARKSQPQKNEPSPAAMVPVIYFECY